MTNTHCHVTAEVLTVCVESNGEHWIYRFKPGNASGIRIRIVRDMVSKRIGKLDALRASQLVGKVSQMHRAMTKFSRIS